MQKAALRSIYSSTQPKMKKAAIVSPVIDDSDSDEEHRLSKVSKDSDVADINEKDGEHAVENNNPKQIDGSSSVLQQRSTIFVHSDLPHLARLNMGQLGVSTSNQELELSTLRPPSADVSSYSSRKYTVLGQKQHWRKSRAQRSRHGQTISPIEDDGNDIVEPISTFGDYQTDVSDDHTSSYTEDERPPSSSAASLSSSRRSESSYLSEYSPRPVSSSSSISEPQRFVVTRQKKTKYTAKIHLPGQNNPLYLGRYKNEDAALAACESAYSTIMTPRK